MEQKTLPKYVLLGILALLLAMVFFLIKPYVTAILSSFVLAYLVFPAYRFAKKYIKNGSVAAFLVTILVVVALTVPFAFMVNSISNEARVNYVLVKKILATGDIIDGDCADGSFLCWVSGKMRGLLEDEQVKLHVTNFAQKITDFFVNSTGNFILSLPNLLLNFFIMLFMVYYLLREGPALIERLQRLMPLKSVHAANIFRQLTDVTNAVIYGQIFVSAIQGILGMIAFMIFGVTSAVLWGIVMFFLALIPFLGTPLVWGPAVILKAGTGHQGQALGLLIAGIIISTIDNFLRPKIVSEKAKVHPILVLLGVLGGVQLFGFAGIIIGPVLLSVFMKFVEIYEVGELEA